MIIRQPDDFHLHLRWGDILAIVLSYTAAVFRRGLVMPNTDPPILTAQDAEKYREEILDCCNGPSWDFEPLMTIKITPQTTPEIIREAKKAGVIAGKVYPEGVTTNSEDGVRDFYTLNPIFLEMEKTGMVLCLHGEMSGVYCLDREIEFLKILRGIAHLFPKLKIVLEHVTTRAGVDVVGSLSKNVAATITAHHLYLILDDVIGGLLQPHNFCKPIAKKPEDREALIKAATSGSSKFFFGSDSAPHLRGNKECASGCAGIFTAPVALPLLAAFFEEHNALNKLEDFISSFGAKFYGLPLNNGTVTLVREPMTVPAEIEGIVPFMANQVIPWRVLK